ncbi:hypothetical protein [Kamptonema sp. UHCC 0994]|uniref:hypothetical protein n=1 Tax=Kamptonema sp. UHCC 0994 TaxID=3031329 RepID=UPI0023BA277E|nr:hypothetical protein [Kamptonema sp. UHCC 0994]MDF0551982.1 hypothetical protein [Kamptonema sp. UHCC 0994]
MKDSNLVEKSKNLLGLIAINLAIAFLCLESLSLAFYFINNKTLFYTRGKTQEKIVTDLERTGVRLDESIVERLHPFFGYVLKQGAFSKEELGLKVNSQGFFSLYDYPFVKTGKNQFIIGVFGGSVANNFATDEYVTKRFSEKLKKFPEFSNKEIVILNFANGGYKQPQQLLILNYFLALGQEFDMVVNIDGFNEVALSNLNNKAQVDLGMPSVQHIQPLTGLANNSLSPEVMSSIVKISETKKQLRETINNLDHCKLALCYTLKSLHIKQLVNNYQQQIITYDQNVKQSNTTDGKNNIVYIPKNKSVLDDKTAFEKMAATWFESSLMMKQLLAKRKIKYFHFIQPNQYYPTKRVFTEKEKRLFLSPDSPYSDAIKKGYPLLLSKVELLQKVQLNIFSAVNILDDTKETVYKDACCHYNAIGDEIFATYISTSIVQRLREEK